MEIWVATTNNGKLNEIKNIFMGKNIEIHTINELNVYFPPKETGDTFTENARIKAKALKAIKPEAWILADDSGLEVIGLNNMPGVHSARYAGEKSSDAENQSKLLKMMSLRSATRREAQFRCSMVALTPSGEEKVFEGLLKGSISRTVKGQNGFGYDPIFIPEGHDSTLAELQPAEKNKISHRGEALKKFLAFFLN